MSRERFDTAEKALNAVSGHDTVWSNFGYWPHARHYPEAAEALARQLADAAGLQAADRVLDLGCGMGEQLRLWHRAYGVRQLTGVNPSASQNAVARAHPEAEAYTVLDARAEDALPLPAPAVFDKVIALDCAYHFASRAEVLRKVAKQLAPGGRFALTDLYLPRPPGLAERVALRGLCRLSHIPYANLHQRDAYRAELEVEGLVLERFDDITDAVLAGFARWWRATGRHQRMPARDRRKFATTAAVIARTAARHCLGYALIVAARP
ncbi:SAM-dependent methyltransferase [Algiphilus sp.]|uniref:SAM-dependent methyltransferase n=1 Tax=Algiphilus sp. TaxID=1872431 RepID=UPI003B5238E2